MRTNVFAAALAFIFIASVGVADNRRVLWIPPYTEGQSLMRGLRFYLIEQSLTDATVYDVTEEDPFGRGEEYDVYKHTSVSCNLNLFLKNDTGFDVAFRNPFGTVIGLTFVSGERKMTMQGNIGMSTMFRGLSDGNEKILNDGDYAIIEFVSMSSMSFESRTAAETAIQEGICDFRNVDIVEPAGIMGEIMQSNESDWRPFTFYVWENFI